jgi:pSer/pThr/pTyr-binding forkhead associated (FHA) protein
MQDVVKVQYALLVDPLTGREFNLARYATSVGRAVSCDIVLTDKSVSRQHCIFYCLKNKFYVEDCGSTNGTTLNGEYIEGRHELNPGDEVRVGLTPLIFLQIIDRNNTSIFIEQTPTHEHGAEELIDRECVATRLARLAR